MVASYLQLLKARYQPQLDSTAEEFIFFAVDGARRMQALIADMLEYSRAGTRSSPMRSEDLNHVMRTVLTNLHAAIAETGAKVVVEGTLPTVVGDPTGLVQVLQNLVANAIKFHGQRTPEVTVNAERIADAWQITVRDNGIGIEPRHSERIFIAFKRLHAIEEYPGTGIGLSVCRKIVERHGGRIWVDSMPGEGSAFHFTLPDRKAADTSGTHELRPPTEDAVLPGIGRDPSPRLDQVEAGV